MNLSEAFDTINHELLIAKLHANEFCKDDLKLIFSCVSNRCQKPRLAIHLARDQHFKRSNTRIFILGPILFNIYFNDLFYFFSCEVCNFDTMMINNTL